MYSQAWSRRPRRPPWHRSCAHRTAPHDAAKEHFATRGAVADDVARNDVLFGDEWSLTRRPNDDPATAEALADIVVGVALKSQRDPGGNERAEAVAGRPGEVDHDRVVRKTLAAIGLGDLVAEQGSDRAVDVADRRVDRDGTAVLQGALGELDQRLVECKFEAVVLLLPLVPPRLAGDLGQMENRREVEPFSLPVVDGFGGVEHLDLADGLISVWNPSSARSSRTSSAMYSKKFSTNSGSPENLARSSGFWWRHRPGRCRDGTPASSRSP